ncbi:hypothetical protein D3C81_1923330 [compost metagenome]
MHDRQEIRRDVQQQGGQHQRQAALDHVQPVSGEFETAARATGLVPRFQMQTPHQQIAFVTGDKLLQRQVLQGTTFDIGHGLAHSRLSLL